MLEIRLQTGVSSHGSNSLRNQLLGQTQTSSQEDLTRQDQQEKEHHPQPHEQLSSGMELLLRGSRVETQHKQDGHPLETDKLLVQHNQSEDDRQHQQPEQNTLQLSENKQATQISEKNPGQHSEEDIQKFQNSESQQQQSKVQQLDNQNTPAADQAHKPMAGNKSNCNIPVHKLIPIFCPHLDKDRQMQLQDSFARLRKNEIGRDDFLRTLRNIVGNELLMSALQKLQQQEHQVRAQVQAARNSQTSPGQYPLQSQASSQQLTMPSNPAQQLTEDKTVSQLHPSIQHQKGSGSPAHLSYIPSSTVEMQKDACMPTSQNSAQKPRETEHQSDVQVSHTPSSANTIAGNQETEPSMVSVQTVTKQQQLPRPMISWYRDPASNYSTHPYPGPSVSVAAASTKSQTQGPQIRQVLHPQGMASIQRAASQPKNQTNVRRYELRSAMNEAKKVHGGSPPNLTSNSSLDPNACQSSSNKDQTSSSSSPTTFPKQELVDQMAKQQLMPPLSAPQSSSSFGAIHIGRGNPALGPLRDDSIEKQSARMGFPTPMNMMTRHQNSGPVSTQPEHMMQMRSQNPSATTPVGTGTNVRTPSKKPSVGQKKPLETLGTPSPQSSKKQKVSGAPVDESIEHLNDVTSVSGVNIREEEEQLLSALKEESHASEANRRVVQEEEERLILQKVPLQKKISEIMSKCGIKNMRNDVERCLSMCVEERMRGLINNLIRLSKQRVDIEKPRHSIFITSDVRSQILMMNRKAKEEWDKKQAEEAEKLRKNNETEGNTGADVDKDKDEGRVKAPKANKEEDDKMRTTAANVAARAAVGGDDMLSKWQLMAEQARKKREGGQDGASGAPGKDTNPRRPLQIYGKTSRDNQEAEHRVPSLAATACGATKKFGWNQPIMSQAKIMRTISVKDVIAVLEREPQMAKSTLIYRLYERMHADAAAE
ncbi:transcription initiation factor TFIID subunit 4b-like isoform X4 [Magnolia sinica]|uniref:transcription initiation factor TFIID subunit 4b-like isoform X4 n=1 Tax=Magnolia sinica TaxID=86752 RepID=UPI00265AB693|nr:transcription initiation factor TFIID subunit 4b-like isoform X4 [Magnolia sinica]